MRKIITLSAIVAAALTVAACGKSETAATDNAAVTEMNAADAVEGTTNDAMTNVDAAAGAEANMAADAANTAADAAGNAANAAGNAAEAATNAVEAAK